MTGHTKGPWSVQVASGALVIFGNSTMPRTVVSRVPNKGYPEVAYYDAHLIAAAPDGLALARYAVDNPDFDPATFDRMAREFIAKATGAQS